MRFIWCRSKSAVDTDRGFNQLCILFIRADVIRSCWSSLKSSDFISHDSVCALFLSRFFLQWQNIVPLIIFNVVHPIDSYALVRVMSLSQKQSVVIMLLLYISSLSSSFALSYGFAFLRHSIVSMKTKKKNWAANIAEIEQPKPHGMWDLKGWCAWCKKYVSERKNSIIKFRIDGFCDHDS